MSKNILYIGEQSIFSNVVKDVVTNAGGEIFDFSSWKECYLQLDDLCPDYLFIDLETIEMELLKEMETSQIPVVMFTSPEMDKSEIKWGGDYKIISKPIEIMSLKTMIDKMLGNIDG